MELVHRHLVKEYIVQLSKRRLILKTSEQQRQLAGQILANADVIQRFCTENVSPGHLGWAAPTPLGLSKLGQVWPEPLWVPEEEAASLQPGLCLQGSLATWLHQALPTLAEILRLQDPNAIKMEVATYATLYPDFR